MADPQSILDDTKSSRVQQAPPPQAAPAAGGSILADTHTSRVPAANPSAPPPTHWYTGVGDTLIREGKAAGSVVGGLIRPDKKNAIYQAASAPETAEESQRFGKGFETKIGPVGRVIDRSIVQPVLNAGEFYRDAAKGKYGDASAVESAMLNEAPEAIGTGGGTVIGGRLISSAANAAKTAGVKAGAMPEATPTTPIGEDILGKGNIPFKGVTAPLVRGGVSLANKTIAKVPEYAGGAAGGVAGGLVAGPKGAAVGAGAGIGLGKLVKGAIPKIPGENFGLSPEEINSRAIVGEFKGLNKEASAAWQDMQKYDKAGAKDSPQYKEALKRYDAAQDRLDPLIKSKPVRAAIGAPAAVGAAAVGAAATPPPQAGKPAPAPVGPDKVEAPKPETLVKEPGAPKPQPIRGTPKNLKKIPVSESAKPIVGTPENLGGPNIGEKPAVTPEKPNIGKRVGIRDESKAARAMQEMGSKSEASLGQFAQVNGTRLEDAISKTEGEYGANRGVRNTIHDISAKNGDLARVADNLKVDISDLGKMDRKGVFNRLLDAGKTPEQIAEAYRSIK